MSARTFSPSFPHFVAVARWIAYAGCVVGTLSSACSSGEYYPLCTDNCAESGAAGAASPDNAGAGGATSGSGGNVSGGGAGSGGASSLPGAGANGDAGSGGSDGGAGDGGSAGAHGGDGSGEPGGSGGEGGAAQPCDSSQSPFVDECVIGDEFAIFAKGGPGGSLAGMGTMDEPFSSLTRAVQEARRLKRTVIACGNFTSGLEITGTGDDAPVRIYGGFACSNGWKPDASAPTVVTAASRSALIIQNAANVEIERFEFRMPTPDDALSSVAGVIANSEGVVLRDVKLTASNGLPGPDGAAPAQELGTAPAGHDGTEGTEDFVGGPTQESCTCAESKGGRGGDTAGSAIRDGETGEPKWQAVNGGQGGTQCESGDFGKAGPGAENGVGADHHGDVDGETWIPADGRNGGSGSVGQGGGGGGGGPNGGGGGGGCGGCGGAGGKAGKGGGASIGLLVVDSRITLESVTTETGNAGNGGDGAPGQLGQEGGAGGEGAGGGCPGGYGAPGGDGARGGGGAGGISVGVVYRGDAPEGLTDVYASQTGNPGMGGDGATPGLAGVAADWLEIP